MQVISLSLSHIREKHLIYQRRTFNVAGRYFKARFNCVVKLYVPHPLNLLERSFGSYVIFFWGKGQKEAKWGTYPYGETELSS